MSKKKREKIDAWMPLYIGDFLAGTALLPRAEIGSYLLLICAYWNQRAPLQDDDELLAAAAKCSPEEWQVTRRRLAPFFQIGSGLWRHKRIDKELATQSDRYLKKCKAGTIGANARWQADSKRDGKQIANVCQSESEPEPSDLFLTTDDRLRAKQEREQREQQAITIYEAYPRKAARQEALKAIEKQLGKKGFDYLLDRTKAYAQAMKGKDQQYIPHPATWFNGARFDEPLEAWRPKPSVWGANRNTGTFNENSGNDYSNIGKI